MKLLVLIFGMVAPALWAGEREVMAYLFHGELPQTIVEKDDDPFASGGSGGVGPLVEWLGGEMEEVSFGKRFVEEGDVLRMVEKEARVEFHGAEMFYNETSGRLVVRATKDQHAWLRSWLKGNRVVQIRSEVKVLSVPGVGLGRRSARVGDLPEGVREVGRISMICVPGQVAKVVGCGGLLTYEGAVMPDGDEATIESEFEISSQLPGATFSIKTAMPVFNGIPEVMEVGSSGDGKTLVLVFSHDAVMVDGTEWDDWILSEREESFLKEERMRGWLKKHHPTPEQLAAVETRRLLVPPTIMSYLSIQPLKGGDPFAPEEGEVPRAKPPVFEGKGPVVKGVALKGLYDLRDLFRQNGISFSEGDYALFRPVSSNLFLKSSYENLQMIEMIVGTGYGDIFPVVALDLTLVSSEKKLDLKMIRAGGFVIEEKVSGVNYPGRGSTLRVGEELQLEVEAYQGLRDGEIEVRPKISRLHGAEMKVVLSSAVTVKEGVPTILGQSYDGGRWMAWVLSASTRSLEVERLR